MNFCKNCGNQVTGRFCQKCGCDCNPQQGEKIEEAVKKLYTLRAGISFLSQELDNAINERQQICKQYDPSKETSLSEEISKNEVIINRVNEELANLNMTISEAKVAKEKQEKRAKFFDTVAKVFFVLAGISPIITFLIFDAVGVEMIWPVSMLAPAGVAVVCAILGFISFLSSAGKYIPISDNDIIEYQKIEPGFETLKRSYTYLKEKNDSIVTSINAKAVEYEKFGSAMYNSLKKQFGNFLNPADWENIDLLIFYFESGRALTLREALQLVDRQRQTDSILDAIDEATEEICRTIERGFLQIETTLIGCTSILSSQLQAIQLQQTNLAISVDSMQKALQSKADTSSQELMEDVHQLRVYADNYSIEKRNS
ncbi:MAG: hypothetical protein IJ400_06785 [Clostridia bacterium]|nr:hypothetical protein [Clostridia bacterium]